MVKPRRWMVFGFGIAGALGGAFACVGDDPNTGGPTGTEKAGERYGACYPNGTCNDGLVCREGRICLEPNDPVPPADASADGGGPSDPDGGGSEGGNADGGGLDGGCPTSVPVRQPGPVCNTTRCGVGETCCIDPNDAGSFCGQDAVCPGAIKWSCNSPKDCSGERCCAALVEETGACSPVKNSSLVAAACQGGTGPCSSLAQRVRLCETTSECTDEIGKPNCKPTPVYLGTSTTPILVGVCSP